MHLGPLQEKYQFLGSSLAESLMLSLIFLILIQKLKCRTSFLACCMEWLEMFTNRVATSCTIESNHGVQTAAL